MKSAEEAGAICMPGQAASAAALRRRTATPTTPKPAIIIAQVAGSGTALVGEKVAKV